MIGEYFVISQDAPVQIYKEMNRVMRAGTASEVVRYQPLIWYIDRGLSHMRPHSGYVFRGIASKIDKTSLYAMGKQVSLSCLRDNVGCIYQVPPTIGPLVAAVEWSNTCVVQPFSGYEIFPYLGTPHNIKQQPMD